MVSGLSENPAGKFSVSILRAQPLQFTSSTYTSRIRPKLVLFHDDDDDDIVL